MGFAGGQTTTLIERSRFAEPFWSGGNNEIDLPADAAPIDLPNIEMEGLPSGIAPSKALLYLKVRALENTNAGGPNAVKGAQSIVVKKSTEDWAEAITAITVPDNWWTLAASARESGDALFGEHDIKATVDSNAIYNIRWLAALADLAVLRLNDVQVKFVFLWEAE